MPNYNNGKIYKLIGLTNNNIYYGSTCQLLKIRKSQHKRDYKCYLKGTSDRFGGLKKTKTS